MICLLKCATTLLMLCCCVRHGMTPTLSPLPVCAPTALALSSVPVLVRRHSASITVALPSSLLPAFVCQPSTSVSSQRRSSASLLITAVCRRRCCLSSWLVYRHSYVLLGTHRPLGSFVDLRQSCVTGRRCQHPAGACYRSGRRRVQQFVGWLRSQSAGRRCNPRGWQNAGRCLLWQRSELFQCGHY